MEDLASRCESLLVHIFLPLQCWQFRKGEGNVQKEVPVSSLLTSAPPLAQCSPHLSLLVPGYEVSTPLTHPRSVLLLQRSSPHPTSALSTYLPYNLPWLPLPDGTREKNEA